MGGREWGGWEKEGVMNGKDMTTEEDGQEIDI